MRIAVRSPVDVGLAIRAVRRSSRVRIDALAATAGVSKQFPSDVEHGRPTAQFGLVPANDPSVLFTTAGMHPLAPYLLGQPHPAGPRLVNVQECVRTGDIDEVGDDSHL